MDEKIRLAAVLSLVAAGLVPGTACRDELVTIPLSPSCTPDTGAPGFAFECNGTCDGECTGECKAEASVRCDGTCDGESKTISCSGGELKSTCDVDASCDANCGASVKASCTPAGIDITFSGAGNLDPSVAADFKTAVDSRKANLAIVETYVHAGDQLQASIDASASVVTKFGG